MKELYCHKELEMIAAAQAGVLSPELRDHADGCSVCSEVLLVGEFLQVDSTSLAHELQPVDAAVIWRRAQARAREAAIAKATSPIRIVRTGAVAIGLIAATWAALDFPEPFHWLDLELKGLSFDGNLAAALTGTTLIGIIATLACVGLSSWYLLRQE
ncbi:MAG TPA: hypothetical protein VMG31_07190 [Verrucomicrobiae bacterium]|nr:hypothetical protein [Verrucomicrobiae bacterium]